MPRRVEKEIIDEEMRSDDSDQDEDESLDEDDVEMEKSKGYLVFF